MQTLDLLPDQIPAGWNRSSAAYDRDIWALMRPYVLDILLHARPAKDARVLDVAAGSGAVTIRMAPHVGEVVAVDFADDMLAQLRARAAYAELSNVRTRVMDGQELNLDDESFDLAVSNFGVIFFPDRVRGMAEMHRVLRPGGRGVITGWCAAERFELFRTFFDAVRAALPDLPAPPAPPPIFSLSDRDQFRTEMTDAGFADVSMCTVRHSFEVASADAYWEMMSKSAPPAAVLLDRVGPESAARIRTTLYEQIAARFGDGPFLLRNEAHLAVGHKD